LKGISNNDDESHAVRSLVRLFFCVQSTNSVEFVDNSVGLVVNQDEPVAAEDVEREESARDAVEVS
jgi:hypothetical protein